MSFPGGTKGHRQEQPLSEDYNTPVAEMETNHILKSTIQRSLESGQVDDDIDVEWAKVVVSAGLPMRLFDNPEVRKTVLMTTECGQNYIRTKPGGVKEPTLTHHTFTTKIITRPFDQVRSESCRVSRTLTHQLEVGTTSGDV
jgi:hypothetical protein